MKNHSIHLLFALLAIFFISGCNSSRKNIKSDYKQSNEENLTINEETTINSTETTNQRTNLNEELSGSMEFTKIEFENGATFFDLSPYRESMLNLWRYQYPNERTENTDNVLTNPGIKSVTSGKLDFNKNSQVMAETENQANTKQEKSLNKELNKTSEITDNEISIEKEKHGFIYYFGIISACIVAGLIPYYFHKFTTWIMPKIAKGK